MATGKDRRTPWAILVLTPVCLCCLPAHAKYGGGSGTVANPYQIWTADQMNAIGAEPNDWGKHFKLMADLDLSAFDGQDGRPAFNIIAVDIDSEDTTSLRDLFTGVFDGNGHTISNFTHVSADRYRNVGLFGYVGGPNGEIRNLGLIDVSVDVAAGWSVGALAGSNTGVVIHCYSTGSVNGKGRCVGGLVGYNYGAVVGCYSTAAVGGDGLDAGGLVGGNDEGAVIHCYSSGPVNGKSHVGGLVGYNWEGDLVQCYSTGAVRSAGGSSGGLVGQNIQTYMGGVVTGCFWDTQTSGQATSSDGIGLTTAQMQDVQTYWRAGWDWAGRIEDGISEIWQMPEGGGYPVQAFFQGRTPPQLVGDGTPDNPYLISNALELSAMAGYSPGAHYRLAAPIDLSGIHWGTAVIPHLLGTFDGNGLTISHLTIVGDSCLGLFGRLGHGAHVRDLGIVDVNVTGAGTYNCSLAARNDGVVARCFSTGNVSGGSNTGGLIGLSNGAVAHCYSTAAVSGEQFAGGLMGSNWGIVTHCYSAPESNPANRLVGTDHGATVGCFWESQLTRPSRTGEGWRSPGATVVTRNLMQDKQTYLEAGWDWVGETANGTSEVWQMPSDDGYPVLAVFGGHKPLRLRGHGTPTDPYLISDALELGAATYHSPCAHYRLAAPIDLSGIRWAVPVMPLLRGVFDGSGLTIAHLTVTGGGDLGLFGTLFSGGEVRDLGVVDCDVAGSARHVGGLVGDSGGLVRRCYSTGFIKSDGQEVGGLIGSNWGTVIQCFNTSWVTGVRAYVGGLVAHNSGTLTDCYNLGAVSGSAEYVGGLMGDNWGAVTRCYSAGMVSGTDASVGGLCGSHMSYLNRDISGSLWDIQTSGQTRSSGGTGKTTTEMQTANTFLELGWDFVGETVNGTEDIWWILEGKDYPRLWWEAAEQ